MGSITSSLFISLDGVIESPDKWHFDYFNDEMGAAVGELMGGNDATLLGRQTYDEFAGYWPNADPSDPITGQMNGARKFGVELKVVQTPPIARAEAQSTRRRTSPLREGADYLRIGAAICRDRWRPGGTRPTLRPRGHDRCAPPAWRSP